MRYDDLRIAPKRYCADHWKVKDYRGIGFSTEDGWQLV